MICKPLLPGLSLVGLLFLAPSAAWTQEDPHEGDNAAALAVLEDAVELDMDASLALLAAPAPEEAEAPVAEVPTAPEAAADEAEDDDEAEEAPQAQRLSTPRWQEAGVASWYGPRFHGRLTASGERFNTHEMTAAHKSLPFGTRLLVRSERTGKEVVVRINDRGPFIKGRIIDLSQAAAKAIGMDGIAKVTIHRLDGTELAQK